MSRKNSTIAAAALILAFSFGTLAPTAEAVTAVGNTSTITAPDSNIQLAYVKKKIVVKKKGTKKTTIVYSHRRTGYAYGFSSYHPRYYGCRTVVRFVKNSHHRTVKVVRRTC